MQICLKLEIILTFSRICLFYRIFTLPIFTLHGKWKEFTNTEWLVFLKICYVIFFIMPDDSKDAKHLISCKVLYKMKHIQQIILICQAPETFAIPLISWKSCMIYIEQNLRQIILLCKALEIYPFSVAHISVQVFYSLNLASNHQ